MAEMKTKEAKDRMQEVRTLFLEMATCCRPGASLKELERVNTLAPEIGSRLSELLADAKKNAGDTEKLELATKAHDLGSTLTLIPGYVDLILHGRTELRGVPLQEKIGHLLTEFEMLLDYDAKTAKKERLDLRSEIEPYLALRFKPTLSFEGESFTVDADRVALWRIFKNLMKNAAEAGAKNVAFRFSGRTLEVGDDGKGMAPEVVQKLFTPFFTEGKEQGTGLGLISVKEQLERMGAAISVESEAGKGTVFTIDFGG